jgi:hypothetical protein
MAGGLTAGPMTFSCPHNRAGHSTKNIMNDNQRSHQQCVWTELLAFDVDQADRGVGEYMSTLGFIPDMVALLITSPDMILQHAGIAEDQVLPPDFCSRDGHDGNETRRRQVWTRFALKDLIARLHLAGSKVYLSNFTHYLENKFHHEWMADHPEVKQVLSTRGRVSALNVLARLKDGSLFQDYFAAQLARVCQDYDFDGWHGADGYASTYVQLHVADCSDDMIEQFVASGHHDLPAIVTRPSEDLPENLQPRIDWIWRHKRLEWIEFWTNRWAGFWKSVVDALHAAGKEAYFNSACTRDPFEAIYRFGLDYKKLIKAGADGIVVETVSGGIALGSGDRYNHDYMAMLMLIKAHVPQTPLLSLQGIKDVVEDYDVLRHTPTALERDIYDMANVYHTRPDGQIARCTDGFLACLADGITSEEWRWMDLRWRLAFDAIPQRLIGATLVWSDAALYRHLAEFPMQRDWSAHRLAWHLLQRGAPIQSTIDIQSVDKADGPLLIPHPHLLEAQQRRRLLESGKPLIAIGPDFSQWPAAALDWADAGGERPMRCRLYNAKSDLKYAPDANEAPPQPFPSDPLSIVESDYFRWDLYFRPVSEYFLKSCVELIRAISGACSVETHRTRQQPPGHVAKLSLMMAEQSPGLYRIAIKSHGDLYESPVIDLHRRIQSVIVRTPFPVTTVRPDGSRFHIPIPPHGIVVVDVQT